MSTKKANLIKKLISQGEEDIRKGKTLPQDEMFLRLEKLIRKNEK